MTDVLFVLATLFLGGLAILYVRACAALLEGGRHER